MIYWMLGIIAFAAFALLLAMIDDSYYYEDDDDGWDD